MQLSQESYRSRWLILVSVWTFAAVTLWFQARLVDDYLGVVGQLGLRGAPAASTPMKQCYPAFAADAQMWVRHALSLLGGDQVQLRYTTIDNAPDGREVHWNSAWAWCIAGAGSLHRLFTGLPIEMSVERATLWLNPLTQFALLVLLSAWATRHIGAMAGVVVAIAMTCHERIYEGFFPSYVDHHGLLTIGVFGLLLGGIVMGGGWWRPSDQPGLLALPTSPKAARDGAIFSALAGACGLWVSAASTIPSIAIVGMAGLLAVIVNGRTAIQQGTSFDGRAWRLWGQVGAIASMVFYLLEYFPRHLGFRLEANHPLHAIAWLGGGELIAQLGERWLAPRAERWQRLQSLVWPVIAVSLVPITILLGGARVFAVADPFMARLHHDYIQEFLPMWRTMRSMNGQMIFQLVVVGSAPLLAAIATLSYRRRDNPIVLWFATFAAGLLTLMAWWQSRWMLNTSGGMVCLILVLIACWTASLRPRMRWIVVLGVMGVLFGPTLVWRYQGSRDEVRAKQVVTKDAFGPLYRDIAATLRASQPQGDITVLSSPNSSVGIGYYGRFKTLGTLYWENTAGLKASAAILGAKTEAEAATLIKAHGVTHVAIISEENFIAQYYQLLHPSATSEEIRQCFGLRILNDKSVPPWLQMIPYRVPDDLRTLGVVVMLFKVNFQQSMAEAIFNVVQSQTADGDLDGAEKNLEILLKGAPQLFQPWIVKGEILLARHDWDAAIEHTLKGIALAPPDVRRTLYGPSAQLYYNQKQYASAVRIYRAGLAENYDPDLASYLAWVLATSTDDSVRNGKEALALAMDLLKRNPNSPSYLNAYAAALAETGRFAEAIEAGDRAVANSKAERQPPATQKTFEDRLAVLRNKQPLRN